MAGNGKVPLLYEWGQVNFVLVRIKVLRQANICANACGSDGQECLLKFFAFAVNDLALPGPEVFLLDVPNGDVAVLDVRNVAHDPVC